VEPLQAEVRIWSDLKEDKMDIQNAIKSLEEIENKSELSVRSIELLSLKNLDKQITFIEERKHLPIIISNYVVCMTTLKKNNSNDVIATSQIIVGTEGMFVFVIDHSGSKIISKFKIPDTPFQILAVGAYDIDYRLHIATRNNKIYTIKNGELTTVIIDVPNKIIGTVRTDKSLIVATVDDYYQSYTPQGKKNFSIKMPHSISNLEILDASRTRNFKGVILTLKNGEIRLYNEKNLINILKLSENIFGVKFGKFCKDEERLVIITESGSLIIKSLSQNINLDTVSFNLPKKSGEDVNLIVPKKTKFYVDLIEREKESCIAMNNCFQNDLVRLRHKTLDTYVKMLKIGNGPTNYSSTSPIKLSASLQGLGPHFKLNLTVDNTGEECLSSIDLLLDYDKNVYCFDKDNIGLGLLMSNVPVSYSLRFRNLSESGVSGTIKIIILDKGRSSPLITSTLKVPISELEVL
jgi:Bardet-Biedl syndrome 1 protein